MKIVIGCDHGGYSLKGSVIELLKELGHEVIDRGCDSDASVNYPDYAKVVCGSVEGGEADR